MRREFIYAHRSVRFCRITAERLSLTLVMALLLSGTVAYFGTYLVATHGQLYRSMLELLRIPNPDVQTLTVFPGVGPVLAPVVGIPRHEANPTKTVVFFVLAAGALLVIHRRVPLAGNFVIFVIILLVVVMVTLAIDPSFHLDSLAFTQIWLRGEVLVWILLPWVSAFLFVLPQPSLAAGIAWTLLAQVHGLLWSALRLAFCLGVLHYTGILFLPVLWFCFGVLSDFLYVLVFYSVAVTQAFDRVVGQQPS